MARSHQPWGLSRNTSPRPDDVFICTTLPPSVRVLPLSGLRRWLTCFTVQTKVEATSKNCYCRKTLEREQKKKKTHLFSQRFYSSSQAVLRESKSSSKVLGFIKTLRWNDKNVSEIMMLFLLHVVLSSVCVVFTQTDNFTAFGNRWQNYSSIFNIYAFNILGST